MELEIYKIDGSKAARKIELNEEIFGISPNDHAIYLDVKQHLANKRQGTHSSKERAVVSGSTKKLKRQKGTGGARAGDTKSPVFVGGGRAFGPHPREYGFKLNKKVKALARKSALSYKTRDNEIMVLEDFTLEEVKTRKFVEVLNNLSLSDKKTLMVIPESDQNIYLSARNIPQAKVIIASSLNTYDILNANKLIIVESSIGKINELFDNK
jgi:large subunit ribosomal protein L4